MQLMQETTRPTPPAIDARATARRITLIEPPRKWQAVNVAELWRFRDVAIQLAWRDIKVRYKQTFLGAGWAIFQPARIRK